jgi:hypothetical protein
MGLQHNFVEEANRVMQVVANGIASLAVTVTIQ